MIELHRGLMGTSFFSLWLHSLNTQSLQTSILLGNEVPVNRRGLRLHLRSTNNMTLMSLDISQWYVLYSLIVPPLDSYPPHSSLGAQRKIGLYGAKDVCAWREGASEGKTDCLCGFVPFIERKSNAFSSRTQRGFVGETDQHTFSCASQGKDGKKSCPTLNKTVQL